MLEIMPKALQPVGSNNTIERELEALSLAVTEYRRALNNEGVWLFLAVLGCWSVTPPWLRLVALVAALLLFGHRMSSYSTERRSFTQLLDEVKRRTDELSTTEQARKANLFDLLQFQKQNLEGLTPFRTVPGFLVGWGALLVTIIATGWAMWSGSSI
ncbi:MAG: hypothetical protein ACRCV9_18315 [Burkholderiaceae bacterium]